MLSAVVFINKRYTQVTDCTPQNANISCILFQTLNQWDTSYHTLINKSNPSPSVDVNGTKTSIKFNIEGKKCNMIVPEVLLKIACKIYVV